ncbi:glycerophosphoryl diester phosphodiesterase membrane domain-containing protein [Sphingomonas sp. 8AM]|uniref:glycerophosphoryl diester phosphodiesterase membrane domain-containing protein n=1 Tax=Sphingomonas sp. 8AM TaxID=2653170 RepID=UPI00135C957C|nr:glycerophosphoryl diester phosphodiesterase membrane domain-containing protein [Sphingomonas sp. 8AM]
MVRIGDVWDRTVDVLRGRTAILTGIVLLTLVLPGIVVGALGTIVPVSDPFVAAVPLIRFATLVLLVLGVLAITAVASDPAVDRTQGLRIAGQRLLPALGVLTALVIAAIALFIPAGVLFRLSGATLSGAGTLDMSHAAPGYTAGAGLLVLLAALFGLWLSARIVPLFGIVVNERRGFGALRRSLTLTSGSTLKLIGVLILYFVLTTVAMLAATSVVGVIARLVLGGDAPGGVAFVVAVVRTLISAGATMVQSVFYARFYVAAIEREQRLAPLA